MEIINMVIKKSFVFIFFIGLTINAQKVSNISFRQEHNTIILSYDLETKSTCKIDLFISTNGGINWLGPLKKVEGDIGIKISSGSNIITWKVLDEYEELRGDNIQFQVRAYTDTDFETVVIGTQEWTIKNLDVVTYSDGTIIPQVTDPSQWNNLTTGAWCYYNNDSANGVNYGKIYNWYALAGIWNESSKRYSIQRKSIAPKGYHVPSKSEWETLTNYLGGDIVAGEKMKATKVWYYPITSSTNTSGFTGLPGGYRSINGSFVDIEFFGSWWSSSEFDSYNAWYNHLSLNNANTIRNENGDKRLGFSVRFIRD